MGSLCARGRTAPLYDLYLHVDPIKTISTENTAESWNDIYPEYDEKSETKYENQKLLGVI